jgi:hypothetical protein
MNRLHRNLAGLLLLASCAAAGPAFAQGTPDGTRPERLYLSPALLAGSGRMESLAGAYVGIAEGAAGFTSNLASLAQRNPLLDRDWDLDATFSYLVVPRKSLDLDNDGTLDDQYVSAGRLLAGLYLQYKNYGLGAYTRTTDITYCANSASPCTDEIHVSVANSVLALAMGFGDDEFIAAFGLTLATATFSYQGESWDYDGTGYALDLLYRPRNRPYRIGLSFKPQILGRYNPKEGQLPSIAGNPLFSALVSPGVLSLGTSIQLGPGAERYNRLAPAARRQALEEAQGRRFYSEPPPEPRPSGGLLLTAQLDVISSTENAAPIGSFLGGGNPPIIGGSTSLVPRAGVEHETLPGRLRTRLGSFLEPSPFPGQGYRPHLTGGLELFVFHYLEDWELSGAFDVAPRYLDFGFSVGFWR